MGLTASNSAVLRESDALVSELCRIHPNFHIYQRFKKSRLRTARYIEMVNKILELTCDRDKIIDVGCGFGDMVMELADKGRKVFATDIQSKKLKVAAERCRRADIDVKFVLADIHHPPFKENSFDFVYGNQIIEHFDDPFMAVRNMKLISCMKLCIIHFNDRAITYILKVLLRKKREILPKINFKGKTHFISFLVPARFNKPRLRRIICGIPVLRRLFFGNMVRVCDA